MKCFSFSKSGERIRSNIFEAKKKNEKKMTRLSHES